MIVRPESRMKPETKSGFVPGHRRLVSPPANSCRTSREREVAFARARWLRRNLAKPVCLTCPFGSTVTWNGARFPPLIPQVTGSGLADEPVAAHAASKAAIATSAASLHTSARVRRPRKRKADSC